MTITTLFWTQIGSIVAYVAALFGIYRVLVQQKDATIQNKDATIQLHKEKIADLDERLKTAKSQSPDILAQSLNTRVNVLQEELRRQRQDNSSTQEALDAKERELMQVRQQADRQTYLATHDALTGLDKRSAFFESAKTELNDARINSKRLAFLVLDVDSFKVINDTYGHLLGDKLLVATAERLRMAIGNRGPLARLGGDVFASVVRYDELVTVETTLREVLGSISKPISIDDHEFSIGVSIGVSLYPQHGSTVEDLLAISDTAMYQAKRQGGAKYLIYAG